MKEFKVVFHFHGEDTKTLFVEGKHEQDVLDIIYKNNNSYVGTGKSQKGLTKINLNQVTYINVYER